VASRARETSGMRGMGKGWPVGVKL
jgi:hypothetical protein